MAVDRKSSVTSAVHRRSVADEHVTSVLAPGEVPLHDREYDADEAALAALGYMYEHTPAQIRPHPSTLLTSMPDPNSSVNFPYGPPSVFLLPSWASSLPLPRPFGLVWDMLALLV